MAEKSSGFYSRRPNSNGVRGRKETHDKCLDAIKEDLASWFTRLLGTVITLETFTSTLDTGVVLCQLANLIQAVGEDYVAKRSDIREDCFPRSGTTFKKRTAFPGSFIARDNVANFIRWCRELGVPDTIMFESDDVVLEKNEKRVLLTLLEVARRAARFGVDPPDLIRMEKEIDQEMDEIAADAQAQQEHVVLTSTKLSRRKSHSLDDLVYQVLEQCTCAPVKYQVVRIAEGKYRMGEQKSLIFVRVMRKNVMVRVGGGWDTLERYFDKHDPCRMQEPRQRRGSVKIPRCRGNEVFTRSPSSLSLGSVSSTDSQDSFNTVTTSSSSHLSGTWPAQPTKRPRDGLTKQRARNPPSSPLLGQSRPKRTGATSRAPPRTIETQARNRRSKSMHELNKLSVETVMGPTYTKQTNSSMRKQSVGSQEKPAKAQLRQQSVASSKTGSNGISGRDPTLQKPFCSTVSRSSSFGSCPRPAPYCRSRAKSVVEAPSRNGLSSSGSSASGREAASEQDEKQRKAKERSRTAQREVRTGTRRGRSTPRELEATQTTPRRGENQTPLQERNNNTALRERSRTPQRKTKDQTPQRKLSKPSDTYGKQSTTSEMSSQSKTRRPSKQTLSHRQQTKTSDQKLSDRTEGKMKEDLRDSKSTLTSPETQNSEENAPVLISLERKSNGTKGSEHSPRSGEDQTEVNDEKAIRGLYEKLLIDREDSAGEVSSDVKANTLNGSLPEELSKVDGTTGETEWNNDCLRHVRVIDFSEPEKGCDRRRLDLQNSRPHNENLVVEDLEREAGELKNMLSEGDEEIRGKAVNFDLRRNGSSETMQADRLTKHVSRENGSPQVPRRRPLDLNLEQLASPAPRDDGAMATTQQPSQKARESDGDASFVHALSNPRSRTMYFDVNQYSRIPGDSDSASTPESPSDSPRKLSLVQSMISSIELRNKQETNISPRAKQPVASTGRGTQDRPAGIQPKTCAKDGSRPQTTMENSMNAGDKNGFQSSRIAGSSSEKNSNITPANHSHTSEPVVTRDRPEESEYSTWRNERRKDSLEGSKEARHTTRKTGNFPRPQDQFTLEEMIEDMLPQEQGNTILGKAVPQSLVPKHGYNG